MVDNDLLNIKINELTNLLNETDLNFDSIFNKIDETILLDENNDLIVRKINNIIRGIFLDKVIDKEDIELINLKLETYSQPDFKLSLIIFKFILLSEINSEVFKSKIQEILDDVNASSFTKYLAVIYRTNLLLDNAYVDFLQEQRDLIANYGLVV